MIYQLKATLFFTDLDPISDIHDKILDHFPDALVINPGQDAQECSVLDIIECHHDEHPPLPCGELYHKDNCPLQP